MFYFILNYLKKIFFLFFIYISTIQNLYANFNSQKEIVTLSKNIANTTTIFLVNFAFDELKNKIKQDMQNKNIEAIIVNDKFLKEDIIIAYKDKNNNIYFSKKLPLKYKKYNQIKQDIIQKKSYTSTILGSITLYYKDINLNKNVRLSDKEIKYLENKKIIKMCIDPNWMPFEMIKDGKHIGITADYIKEFSNKIDTKISLIPTKTWSESIQKAKNRECDIFSLASKTKSRELYMDFTSPYITTQIVIATKVGIPFIDNINHILDKKLGVVQGYSLNETLKKEYPNINIVEVNSIKDGLDKVQKGEIFGYIDNTIVINYEIQKNFMGAISVSGKLDENVKLSIATRSDEKILLDIFQKVVLSIEEHTKYNILSKWVKTNYTVKTDYKLLFIFSSILLFIILITIYWNLKLSKLNKELSKQRDIANAATKSKSQFLANMSHEIRTPMNGIMGMTAIALKSNLDKKNRNYIKKIDLSAKNLLNILNDILDFSKIEAGKLEIEKVDFNLKELIDSVLSSIEIKAKEKNLKLFVNYGENIEDYLYADSLRISQILINLLGNAVKFTSKGEVSISITKNNNLYRFEVKDTGIGIDEKQQKSLFLPFIQSDGSITKKYGGTGLGLSISKQLVNLMGGKIWIESQKGIGSSFIFELDIASSDLKNINKIENSKKDVINNIKSIKNLKILLVEDNKINQEIVVTLLEDSDIVIDIANNGKEATDIFNKNRYDLILMDIHMPIMDGYEATRIIREKDKNIPIIGLSANVMKSDIEKSKDAGMDDYLNKPIDVNNLYKTILKYTNNKSDISTPIKDEVETLDFQSLDVKSALVYLGGNKKLYLKVLKKFKDNYQDLKLKELEKDEFKIVVHTLKGLSINIGAIKLHNILKELNKEYDDNLIIEFNKEFKIVLDDLKKI